MAKGEDALRRKKNKAIRKRMRGDDSSSTVSGRIAAIIAAKQRRKNGKRRMCEGMCFSLPTLDDPFNDKHDQKKVNKKNPQNSAAPPSDAGASVIMKDAAPRKDVSGRQRDPEKGKFANAKFKKSKAIASISRKDQRNTIRPLDIKGGVSHSQSHGIHGSSDGPSKFLIMCLNTIQDTLLDKVDFDALMEKGDLDTLLDIDDLNGNSEHSLLLNKWGAEFLECSLLGTDILETTGVSPSAEQIGWMVSIAADIITTKEKECLSVANPFLLILVPSKEKAIQVRSVCKPLKALGIHTVSLHTGASLDHQIQGLKSCEPEFLVSTPDRLLELVSLKAIDISGLSFLVVDALDSFAKAGLLDQLKAVKESIVRASLTVVFCDSFGPLSTAAVRTLLDKPITRLSHTDSIASQSACISQCIHLCASEKKSLMSIRIINEECGKQLFSECLKVLLVGETSSNAHTSALLIAEGYSISDDDSDGFEVSYSKGTTMVTVTDLEHIDGTEDVGEFEIIVMSSFPSDIDDYVKILTGMARQSVNGVLHSCLSEEDAPLAGSLIEILEQCDQNVPEFVRNYHDSQSMSEH